jgi:integrase
MPKTTSKISMFTSKQPTSDKITLQESNLAFATKREYLYRLEQFYADSPISSEDELIDCPSEELQKILLNYLRFLLAKVSKGELSANTIPKMFRGIRWLLNSNYRENDIKWKPLESLFPKSVKRSGYKAWTSEQISLMIDNTANIRNKAIIHFQASTGGRIGVHDHPLLMKHLVKMEWQNQDCYAVILYADESESVEEKDMRDNVDDVQSGDSYWAFLTPEATEILERYFDERKRHGEVLYPSSAIFSKDIGRKIIDSNQLGDGNIRSIIFSIVRDIPELKRQKNGRRHDIQLNHGFRKRMNTILKLETNVNSNIAEKIMGHKNGLDGVYLAPTRQQCFKEFVKGIPQLTISESGRKEIEIVKLESEKSELMKLQDKVELDRQAFLTKMAELEKKNQDHAKLVEDAENESQERVAKMIKKSQKKIHPDKIQQILEILQSN